ncbi:MAG: NADH-quinone oxidoreductase subunit NuoE family protein [Planctomycetota bacterium]|jgi:NADH:ubiquinone oxidoreductase subunit E
MIQKTRDKVGAVLVVGGGVGGMQASLDLAESGYKVYLVEKGPSIGGPTNDCAMCTLAPRMVDCGRHLDIEKLTYSEIESIEGEAGNFKVNIRKKARSVDPEKCTGCGECTEHCLVRNIVYLEPPDVPKVEMEVGMQDIVDAVISRYEGGKESLVPILQGITNEFNWLPQETLMRVAEVKQIPIEHILRIATFYKSFSLEPRGKNIITVCMGTACHVKGAPRILERFERDLGIDTGQTTPDMQFTLEAVRCIGCCGLSPVITVGDDLYGKLTPAEAAKVLDKYRE